MKITNTEKIVRMLELIQHCDCPGDFFWNVNRELGRVDFHIAANDLFWWGVGDCVHINDPEVLAGAITDCGGDAAKENYAPQLAACRIMAMRPQGAYYETFPKEMWPLFDACGRCLTHVALSE